MGRVVTMIYAIVGVPLFLIWLSQMGTLFANLFKMLYYKVCCGLCRRGKRRKALALAAKNKRQEEKQLQASMMEAAEVNSLDLEEEEKSLRCLVEGGGAVKSLAATPLHLTHSILTNSFEPGSPQWDILPTCLQPCKCYLFLLIYDGGCKC